MICISKRASPLLTVDARSSIGLFISSIAHCSWPWFLSFLSSSRQRNTIQISTPRHTLTTIILTPIRILLSGNPIIV